MLQYLSQAITGQGMNLGPHLKMLVPLRFCYCFVSFRFGAIPSCSELNAGSVFRDHTVQSKHPLQFTISPTHKSEYLVIPFPSTFTEGGGDMHMNIHHTLWLQEVSTKEAGRITHQILFSLWGAPLMTRKSILSLSSQGLEAPSFSIVNPQGKSSLLVKGNVYISPNPDIPPLAPSPNSLFYKFPVLTSNSFYITELKWCLLFFIRS